MLHGRRKTGMGALKGRNPAQGKDMQYTATQYEYLIFDADHTVIDFDADERRAFRAAFAAAGKAASADMVEACWAFSARNWGQLGLNDVHLPELRARYHELYHTHVSEIIRYMDTMYALGGKKAEAQAAFSDALAMAAHPVEGAVETLTALAKRYRLCIATNGLAAMQAGRLSELAHLFSRVFVSEEMGVIKPDAAFFTSMLDALRTTADRCLMIGDSLSSDIAGANAVGMDCIWFNRRGAALPDGVRVKAVIKELKQLLCIL